MNTKLLQILIVSLILFPALSVAQDNERFKISFWFGVREIARDSMPDNANLDFMNYVLDTKRRDIEQYAGIGFQYKPFRNWDFELKFTSLSDLDPRQFDLNATRRISPYLRATAGIFTFPVYIEDYFAYHFHTSPGFIGDINSNFRQRIIREWGIKTGVVFALNHKRFNGLLKANAGMASFDRFDESVAQKKNNANLRREFRYATHFAPSLFFNPELEAGFDCFKLGNTIFGAQLKTNLFITRQAINYTRTVYYWTEEAPETQRITNPRHSFLKYDADLGVYCRF
jgi:hypothetical protein